MSKITHTVMIEDINNTNCSQDIEELLIDQFSSIIKKMGIARKAWYELADSFLARNLGISKFNLTVERKMVLNQEQYWGCFECNDQKLELIATLEDL